jgi:hypothetical protein
MGFITYAPLTFMFFGFAIVAANAWMIGNKRHRAFSRRGIGLYLLGIFCLSVPAAFVLPLFAPARAVVRLTPATAGGVPVLVAETTSLLPPWMGAKRLHRLAPIDPATGRRLTRASLGAVDPSGGSPAELVAASPDRLWYDGPRGLELRNPATGKVIVNKRQLVELYPQLGVASAGEVATSDGHVFRTERGSDKVTLVTAPPPSLPPEPAALPIASLPEPARAQAALGVALAGPDSIVVAEGSAVVRKTLDGKLLWSAPLPGPPTAAAVMSGTLFVGAAGRLFGLDPATGARKLETAL